MKKKIRLIGIVAVILLLWAITILYLRTGIGDREGAQPGADLQITESVRAGVELHPSGLIRAEGVEAVVNNCTQCHSIDIITQNRLTEQQWRSTIQWMQQTQNLWDLGENEEIIIHYLVHQYPPVKKGRRANLSGVEWYELEP